MFAQLSIGRCVGRVVFFAAWREKATGFYLQGGRAPVVCKRIRTTLYAARCNSPGVFRCEKPRCDLRRPASHPASLRLLAQGGTRSAFPTFANSALPNS